MNSLQASIPIETSTPHRWSPKLQFGTIWVNTIQHQQFHRTSRYKWTSKIVVKIVFGFFYFAPFFMSSFGLKIILMQITCLFLANVGQKATKYLIPTPFPPRTFRPVFIFPFFFAIFTGCFLLCCVFLHKNNHSIHESIYSLYLFCCPTKNSLCSNLFFKVYYQLMNAKNTVPNSL